MEKNIALFFKEGISKFKTHGALLPSSRFLVERILKQVEMKDEVCIIELGAGTGAFTKHILKKLPKNGKLIVLEVNPSFVAILKDSIRDDRVHIIRGDAKDLGTRWSSFSKNSPDYIVSSLPLGNFSKKDRQEILDSISKTLGRKGIYLQFQYLMASYFHIKKIFNMQIVGYEYKNLPPAFIYKCQNKYVKIRV